MQADFNKAVGDCSDRARPTTSQQIAHILPNFAALCTYVGTIYVYTQTILHAPNCVARSAHCDLSILRCSINQGGRYDGS